MNIIKHATCTLCAVCTPISTLHLHYFYLCVCIVWQNERNHRLMENAINVVGIQFQNQFATHTLSGALDYPHFFSLHLSLS